MFTVYKLTSLVSGKSYVGWSRKTAVQRFADHCKRAWSGSNTHLHAAIRKYGTDSWVIETIAVAETAQRAKELEIKFIAELGTYGTGYNMTVGGDGLVDPTGMVAQRISATLKGYGLGVPKSEATRQRMRKPKSAAHALAISQGKKGRTVISDAQRQTMRLARLGKKMGPASPERKEKIRHAITAWWKQRREKEGIEQCQTVA